ncbi:hypothetical protein NDU88_002655 [Pleurodeles waltl]|uniref:Uncharacterized protein n=1 Tax=Pleurodeles waltl TaxID=8319 RepID=A0AAV7LG68_PLEWA|nr:hypothetical protein NDU88_002655 [Pleurodeles waltl]
MRRKQLGSARRVEKASHATVRSPAALVAISQPSSAMLRVVSPAPGVDSPVAFPAASFLSCGAGVASFSQPRSDSRRSFLRTVRARVQACDEEVDGLDPNDLREYCSARAGNCHDVRFTAAEEASVLHCYQCMRRQSLITLQGWRGEQLNKSRPETHHGSA